MKPSTIISEQLEIGFDHRDPRQHRPAPRLSRAQWWFRRMRRVVNQALDWTPTPPARPEQIYLALANSR